MLLQRHRGDLRLGRGCIDGSILLHTKRHPKSDSPCFNMKYFAPALIRGLNALTALVRISPQLVYKGRLANCVPEPISGRTCLMNADYSGGPNKR